MIKVMPGSATDDTFGHEFTHGVIESMCNLGGSGETGAIRESLCDMWGEWIDLENSVARSGSDDPADKWELWEDDLNDPIPLQRNMKYPPKYGSACGYHMPDRRGSPYWYTDDLDDYGVHHNCGVGNKLAYLLCDGTSGEPNGPFNTYTITGLGIPDTAALFYECQRYLLPPSLDYYDLGYLLMLAARNLGMPADQQTEVEKACRAVEIYKGNSVFSIQSSSGVRVAWFDDLGNLYLAGRRLGMDNRIEGHWKLDETSGSTADDSVGSNNGNVSGAQWTTGQIDGALEFNGSSDYVSLSAIDALEGNNVTISAWINADDPGDDYSPIFRQCNSAWNGYNLCIRTWTDAQNNIHTQASFYGGPNLVVRGDTIKADEWYHLVGTYDGEQLRIYVDGRMSEALTVQAGGCNDCEHAYMGLGVYYAGNCYFDGTIDDVRVYNYPLSRKEVRYLPSPDPDELVFRIENSESVTVAGFDASGYLFLEGLVHEGATIETTDNFVITDSTGEPVAYIDDSGELYLAGYLYE